MNHFPPNSAQQMERLKAELAQLQQTIRLMEEQRQQVLQQRRRRLAFVGGSLSMLFHLVLMIYLALIYRGGGGGGEAAGTTYQIAILDEQELTNEQPEPLDDLQVDAAIDEQMEIETPALEAATSAPAELGASTGSIPTLGGSGGGGGGDLGMGGGGGGGAASFFGIGSKGTRFAFIMDVSGSMGERNKLEIARRELIRSVAALPDFASFYVLLFSSDFFEPPFQKGWIKARKPVISQFITWMNQASPGGGTMPRTSFVQVFSLAERPDVIYFLTDGIFQDITADEITAMNRSGKRAIIHTIQFGDRGNEELMRKIAKSSGGVYRFVPAEGE